MAKRFPMVLALSGVLFLGVPAFGADSRPLAGLAYSPSNIRTEAEFATSAPPDKLRADLAPLAAITPRLRTYAMSNGLDQVVPIAKDLGLKVSVGIWLQTDPAIDAAETTAGIMAVLRNPTAVDQVFVGNEVITSKYQSIAALKARIAEVKAALTEAGLKDIPVSTAETWNMWLAHPELAKDVDFIGAHIWPYWDGVPVADAVPYVLRRYKELQAAFPGKKIVIAETGWPAAGPTNKGAVPSQENQERFVRAFTHAAAGLDYYLCEAYSQPWKAAREGSVIGSAWGIMDDARKPKFTLR
ncbi:MAG: hypothetical protein K1X51_01635 [Rhodospirillaceae bacterium]|nr:hypothetical protein [Rhodospirillaceae bacterium]